MEFGGFAQKESASGEPNEADKQGLHRNLRGTTQEQLHLAGQKCEVEELVPR